MNFVDVYGPYPNHLKLEEYAVNQSTIYLKDGSKRCLKTQLDLQDDYVILDYQDEWTRISIPSQPDFDLVSGFQPVEGWVRTEDLNRFVQAIPSLSASTHSTHSTELKEESTQDRFTEMTWDDLDYSRYLNRPYRWGGKSIQSTDCSGLVYQIYRDLGHIIPRYAQGQYQICQPIQPKELIRGDLIFGVQVSLGSPQSAIKPVHVMIYLGQDQFLESCGLPGIFSTRLSSFQEKWARSRESMWSGWPIEGTDYQVHFGRPVIE